MCRKVVGSDTAEAWAILSQLSTNWTKTDSKIARPGSVIRQT